MSDVPTQAQAADSNVTTRFDVTIRGVRAVRRRRTVKKVREDDVDRALTLFHGERRLAAEYLGITTEAIQKKILYSSFLRLKWTKQGAEALKKMELLGNAKTFAELQLTGAYQVLVNMSSKLVKRIEDIELRIKRGEEARTSTDPEFVKQHAFRFNDKGEPSEEAMLRQMHLKYVEELRNITQAFANGSLIAAKTQQLLQSAGKNGGHGKMKNGKPAFAPKRAIDVPSESINAPERSDQGG